MNEQTMAQYLYELPEQFTYALQMELPPPILIQDCHNIVVSGLGGSAIGGDIARGYAARYASLPVIVNRDYDIPNFVNEKTLFLAVSYSGNTEETLSSYYQACARGARIVCVTSGGKLESLARENQQVLLKIPGGLVPRAATGYLLAPVMLYLEKLGIAKGAARDIQECAEELKILRARLNPESTTDNPAMNLARLMNNKIPIIWGTSGFSDTAALRWKAQINENAKALAYYNVFPELNHNEIVGFETPEELLKKMFIIFLCDQNDHDRVKKRMAITEKLIKGRAADVVRVESKGQSWLARLYTLFYIGDYTSYYLALEYGINPTPIQAIDFLKDELAQI